MTARRHSLLPFFAWCLLLLLLVEAASGDDAGYYSTLGVKKKTSTKDIKKAYKKLALKYHPDKCRNCSEEELEKNEQKFVKVAEAYSVLSDDESRDIYDRFGKKGLEAKEKGVDPEAAGFGFGGGGGGGGFGGGGFSGGAGFDAFSMFEEMFGGAPTGGRRRGGQQRMQFNFGGGGFPGGMGGGFPGGGMGGFPGGGGGRPAEELFPKGGDIAPLGKAKFPDSSSKFLWLAVFYDNSDQDCMAAKPNIMELAKKVKGTFKVGAVNCGRSESEAKFCVSKGIDLEKLPVFGMVVDAKVSLFEDAGPTPSAKALHNFAVEKMPFSFVQNINHVSQVDDRLRKTARSKRKAASVLLLTDKYETSPLYASLAYQYRSNFAFGESRAKNLGLAKEFGAKKYPLLIALVPSKDAKGPETVIKYDGAINANALAKWLDRLEERLGIQTQKKKK
jgi:curved DNA-binding protein CbpA